MIITSEQYQNIIRKHGKINIALIEKETGVIVPKGKKVKIKAPVKQFSNLKFFLKNEGIKFEEEYKFHPTRKWRFDLAIPELKLACEWEGIMSEKSRHTSIRGFSGDCEKYTEAAKLGWKVFRYTVLNQDKIITDICEVIKK